MDVKECTVQGPMAEKVLDGHKVRTLFVEVRGEGMTEGVCRDRKSPSDTLEVIFDVEAGGVVHDVGIRLCAGKDPSSWFSVSSPVVGEDVQGIGGEHGVPLGPVLRTTDENPEVFALDIFVTQRAGLADAKTR